METHPTDTRVVETVIQTFDQVVPGCLSNLDSMEASYSSTPCHSVKTRIEALGEQFPAKTSTQNVTLTTLTA